MSRKLSFELSGFTGKEYKFLKKLSTPAKIQDFLNTLPFDFARGDTLDRSVRGILKKGKADCAGGAVLATAALWVQGRPPLLLDLKASSSDSDHVVALFWEKSGRKRLWGAISKTNHAVLRYREPVYQSVRELALSYFHEYFLPNGQKSLKSFSKQFNLSRCGSRWLTDSEKFMDVIYELDHSPHYSIASSEQRKKFRKADSIEIKAGDIKEW